MQAQAGGGNAPANNFACSSMSGISSRASPLGGSPGLNKSVAFSKPTSTVIPGGSPGASSHTRMGSGFGINPGHPPPGQHQSSLRAGPRLRAEGLMVPPASDAATLRRQVAALQIDLEAHIDGEQRLQSINQQLRERFFFHCPDLFSLFVTLYFYLPSLAALVILKSNLPQLEKQRQTTTYATTIV